MISNKKLNSTVTEPFTWGRRLNILLVFVMQSYLKVPKDNTLNSTHYFIIKIPSKRDATNYNKSFIR